MQFDKLTKTKTVENLLGTVSTFALLMGAWQLTATWYKIRHTDEQELALHWDIQNKATLSSQI